MRKGFFNASQLPQSRVQLSLLPKCGACQLKDHCQSPKIPVTGKGKKEILIVGDYPRDAEDLAGKNFVGEGGRLLERVLRKNGVELDDDCWSTHALICRPAKGKLPQKEEKKLDYCRPLLLKAIKEYKPKLILALGDIAVKSLIRHYWTTTRGSSITLNKWTGSLIPLVEENLWIAPNYDPYTIVADEKTPVRELMFQKYMRRALRFGRKRPWEVKPDFRSEVGIIYDTKKAARMIKRFMRADAVAFDYETNCGNVFTPGARIYCCSVSDGKTTIAFPWVGRTERAMKQLLTHPVPKIGQNIKFEHNWTRQILGVTVVNWYWDCMLGAHVLDSRGGITSLKFQTFTQFGERNYDDHIKPFFDVQEGTGLNQIHLVDKGQLYLYCGIDSLFTHRLSCKQMNEYGYPLPGWRGA